MSTTALQVRDDSQFAITTPAGGAVLGQILDLGLAAHELPTIKVPSGGGITWEAELADGVESSKELDVIIVWAKGGIRKFNLLGLDEADGPSAPDCQADGNGPQGVPRGYGSIAEGEDPKIRECAQCPKNAWGSAGDGKRGKACAEYLDLYCFLPNETMPAIVRVPPTSLKPAKKYIIGQLSKRGGAHRVVTTLTLRKEKDPQPHGVIEFAFKSELPEEAAEEMMAMNAKLQAAFPWISPEELEARAGAPRDVEEEAGDDDGGADWTE